MAISNLNLNVTANTARALADFNKFSRSLDNKFLISGLKLDVVRSALGQINRDFQKAIGEQGLASASSLRAAQNQAALLTQTFKGFAAESALAITNNIGTALNKVAVTAGGTMKDVQKTLLATPFISTRLSEDVRLGLSKGILDFQKNIRRAGLGENFGGVAQQFLMGNRTTMQMVQSGNPLEMFLGSELIKRGAGVGEIASPEMRSKLLKSLIEDPALQEQLEIAAKRTAGFRIILEDLNTKLFNPESGVFGSLRQVVDSAGKSTNLFDEVYKIVDQVFGEKGLFATLVKSIRSVFGSFDPMRPFIDAVQFMTRVFKSITDYFNSDGFRGVLGHVKGIVDSVTKIFTGVFKEVTQGTFDSSDITYATREIGESVREYIKTVGEGIRDSDDDKVIRFVTDIAGNLFTEVGKTAIVLIRELFATLIQKAPEIAGQVLPALNRGVNSIFDEVFGQFSGIAKAVMATMPGPIGAVARASMITDATGGQGGLGLLGAAAPFLLRGGGGLAGMGGRALTGTGGGATAFRTLGAGLLGADPALSLALGFAPQIRGGASAGLRNLNAVRTGFMNSRVAAYLSSYGGSAANLVNRGGQGLGNLLSRGAYTASGYLGALGPMYQNLAGGVGSRYSAASGFLRGQQSQFMAGFRPPFPNVAVGAGTTRAYNLGQFARNLPAMLNSIPSNLLSSLSRVGSSILQAGTSFASSARTAASPILSAGRALGSGVATFGRAVASQAVFAALEIQRAGRMFALGASGSSLFTRNRPMVKAGAAFSRFGGIGLAGGATVLGSQLLGRAVGGEAGQQISGVGTVLGSGASGASLGAMIGSVIAPGVGTVAGAVIGGIIGGIAPLLDKGVRDGVGKFIENLGKSFTSGWNNFSTWISEAVSWAGKQLQDTLKAALNGIIMSLNLAISAFTLLPRVIVGGVEALFNKLPENMRPDWAQGTIDNLKSITSFQIPTMYSGKDYYGPAMALEARMSGRNPMIVNDGEFVIPKDGFGTLAGLVGQNLRTTGIITPGTSQPVQVNVSLAITTNSVVANADELAAALRDPVYKIIGDAWNEAYNTGRVQRPRVN